eukprot:4972030-Pyramimonas_sp.AAC.1
MLKFVFAIVAVAVVGLLRHAVVVQQVPGQQHGGLGLPEASKKASTIQARMHVQVVEVELACSSWPRAGGRAGYRCMTYTHGLRNVQRGSLVPIVDGGAWCIATLCET